MKKNFIFLALSVLIAGSITLAQSPSSKGYGKVFFTETFGWENTADPKGWTAPAGCYFLDPLDIGYNWVWWPPGQGFADKYTQDPPLNSTTRENGCIALFLEQYNLGGDLSTKLDNSIVFPKVDCSSHSSVVVRYETHFMSYLVVDMFLEISIDDWFHSASYNVGFGCVDKDRPMDKAAGIPAVFEANISDVAAGMANLQMRLHWRNTSMYYWAVDDFTLAEAYTNDLKLNYVQMEWDNGNPYTSMAWVYNIPKSQLDGNNGFFNFQSSVINFGENDQERVYLDLDITKNGNSVFHKTSTPAAISRNHTDTVNIFNKYSPIEYGHYQISWDFQSNVTDDTPDDNKREIFFNVTDSVYSRSGDTSDFSWSFGKKYYNPTGVASIGHFIGSVFPIFNDCEASSISAFITGGKADDFIHYRFTLFSVPVGQPDETPFELLTSEMIQLDSADFNSWVTLSLTKDGESEFLKKGDLIYVGIQYDNLNPEFIVRRNMGLAIGTGNSVKLTESSAIACYDGNWYAGQPDKFITKRSLMIRLNLNDHKNINDDIKTEPIAVALSQNFPNPFTASTQITYELANQSEVVFMVTDITGRKVMEINKGTMPDGKHNFILETHNLDNGVYFYTLKAGNYCQTRQMVITR